MVWSLVFYLGFGCTLAQKPMIFIHPGAVNCKPDLDFVKLKIKTNEKPWANAFNQVRNLAKGGIHTQTYINSNAKSTDAEISKGEAKKVYANALTWYFTNEAIYAKQAVEQLKAWSSFHGFTGGTDQDKLQAGWIGALLGPAAEIMSGYAGWTTEDMNACKAMFRQAFYPQLNTASPWNGNVDLTQIDAMMNIAVFNEDEAEFKMGLQRLANRLPAYIYLTSDGSVPSINGDGDNVNKFWTNPVKWVDGLTQETCRDNGHHAQYGMASALHAAEVAWNQGVDVYTPNTVRFTAAMELMATQLLTGNMQGTCNNNLTNPDLYDTWEVGYNHYHNRKGIDLPNTKKLIMERVRPDGKSDWNIFFETLTHAK